MKHLVLPCNNRLQDQWSALYLKLACTLIDTYGLDGKAIVREGVRHYAYRAAECRRQELLAAGCKTNLETFFSNGFGLPCGERTVKEWIRHTEQELFVTVCACPYAQAWEARQEVGRMFCEEYYPALVHAGTNEKAQINLGYTMLNGRDNTCRLSIYLRPANVPASQRAQCFPAFDLTSSDPNPVPAYSPDFEAQKRWLYESFFSAAQDRGGDACTAAVRSAVKEYAAENEDAGFLAVMEE